MLQYRLYGGGSLPSGLEGFIKAAANIGSVIGQLGFGILVPLSLLWVSEPDFSLKVMLPITLVERLFVSLVVSCT